MPYDDIPTENAPALAPRVDEYLFEIDLAGTHPDGNPRSTLDDLDPALVRASTAWTVTPGELHLVAS